MMSEAGIKAMRARQRAEAEAKAQAAFARELTRRVAAMTDEEYRRCRNALNFSVNQDELLGVLQRALGVEAPK